MISVKAARDKTEQKRIELVKQHKNWIMKRAEIDVEAAIERGVSYAIVDAFDLHVEAIAEALTELEGYGYEAFELHPGQIKICW